MSGRAPRGADSPALPPDGRGGGCAAAAAAPLPSSSFFFPSFPPSHPSFPPSTPPGKFRLRGSLPDRRFLGPLQQEVLFSCPKTALKERFERGKGALGLYRSGEGRRAGKQEVEDVEDLTLSCLGALDV